MSVGVLRKGFSVCQYCSGMGFMSRGEFYDRKFIPCLLCKGVGYEDVEPCEPPPAIERPPLPKNW
jgi:hypothetical protein